MAKNHARLFMAGMEAGANQLSADQTGLAASWNRLPTRRAVSGTDSKKWLIPFQNRVLPTGLWLVREGSRGSIALAR